LREAEAAACYFEDMKETMAAIKQFFLKDDGVFPNNPKWPLLIVSAAVELRSGDPAEDVEKLFRANGWGGLWRNGIYPFHHCHSNSHEALGVYAGTARVQFGGSKGVEVELRAGDVAILPAGTAHKNLGCSPDFSVVGAYPPGSPRWNMCYGKAEEHVRAVAAIKQVPRPERDPVFGTEDGVCKLWVAD
jgi:uncharacterized protein YjlB